MIAKLGSGAGFSGCAKYDLDEGQKNNKQARLLDSGGVPLTIRPDGRMEVNARDIGRAFRAQAMQLNPGVKKPVGRIMLSFGPKDTPRMSDAYMVRLAQEYMQRMGIVNTQYTIVRRSEKEHQHVHIIYNRVDNDGKLISDSNNFLRSAAICKDITLREGLTWGQEKSLSSSVPNDPAEKLLYETARTVRKCVEQSHNLTQLCRETARHGITTHIKENPNTKRPNGICFSVRDAAGNERHFKGSQLDRSLSIGNILKAFSVNGSREWNDWDNAADYREEESNSREGHLQEAVEVASSIAGLFGNESSRRHKDEKIGEKRGRGMHM